MTVIAVKNFFPLYLFFFLLLLLLNNSLVTQAVDNVLDHYASLGISKQATQKEIRSAYRKLSLKWHPDKHEGDKEVAQIKFQAIGDAYETLGDPDKRVIYDEYGGQEFTSQWEFQMAQQAGKINPKSGFYRASDIVKTVNNQGELNRILKSGKPVLMEFYAPWCVHCQQMVQSYKKAAVLLEEIAVVGAVNCDATGQLCPRQQIHQFPTIKFFYLKKGLETVYDGGHSPEEIHEFVVRRLDNRVVNLNSRNFDYQVMNSKSLWLIDFSAGDHWCGPCRMLKSHLQDAAYTLKKYVKVGIVNCDNEKSLCDKYSVQHFPFLKLFPKGPKDSEEIGQHLHFEHMHFPAVGILDLMNTIITAALKWRPQFDEEIFRSKLLLFYELHNPSKVDTVDALASKHEGHEDDLIMKLEKRYRVKFDDDNEDDDAEDDNRSDL
jgi:thioredoxin-like negative regulator of GroEL